VSSPSPLLAPGYVASAFFELRIDRVRAAIVRALGERAAHAAAIDASLAALRRCRPPEHHLARRFGLSQAVVDFLWTAIAIEIDPRLLDPARRLAGGDVRRGATVALHANAFGLSDEAARALAVELDAGAASPIGRVLIPAKDGDLPSAASYVVPRRVRGYLAGRDDVDPLVARVGGLLAAGDEPILDERQREAQDTLARALDERGPLLVVVEGPEGVGRAAAVAHAAAATGRAAIELDLVRHDARAAALDDVVDAWWRECLLRGGVGLVANCHALADAERRRLAVLLDPLPGVIAAIAPHGGLDLGLRRPVVRVRFPIPDAATRHRLWARAADGEPDVDLDLLAGRYHLGAGAIDRSVRAARVLTDEGPLTTAAVVAGVRSTVAERLGDVAVHVPAAGGWDDLVLPEETLDQIRLLVSRVRHGHRVLDVWGFGRGLVRGRGLAALLSGPPGTGKTLAAGIVARELDLDLYQVDMSRVLSKWIGETEKQLAALFDAAEAGHALLLFDEADSLFAKRTEVKGATDRYANLEVNYLLQRIEAFGGVTLLTTNFDTAIDPAVRRRLAAHITFWPPNLDERERLWRRMVPAEVPVAGALDFGWLAAKYPQFTGGHIRNAAMGAAFRAAAQGESLSMAILERAARAEYEAMGRVVTTRKGDEHGN
jgi:hypothetical protein